MTPASVGLTRYYQYVLSNIGQGTIEKIVPTKHELQKIEEEEYLDDEIFSNEDLKAILDRFSNKKTIH